MDKIKEGDSVKIQWETIEMLTGVVEYIPCDVGDSWRIKGHDGKLYYVQTFCKMEKL